MARGILEMLWEPAYDSGDDALGDAEDIAARCGWARPAVELVDALEGAGGEGEIGFIEPDPERPGRYRIHDLFDHAPDGVAKRVQREVVRLQRGTTISELRAEAGRKGMERRWGYNKRITNGGESITTDNNRLTKTATPSPSPSPSPSQEAASAQSASPPPKRGRKETGETRTPNPRVATLNAALFESYRDVTGDDYAFQGRDWPALAKLAEGRATDEEIVRRWRKAWTSSGFDRPTDIHDFAAKWNRYGVQAGTGPPRDVTRGVVRAEHMDHSKQEVGPDGTIDVAF